MAEASEKSFPFDSEQYGGKYDREYVAEDFTRYFRAFISSGIFLKEPTNLQVIANGDMSVTLKPGSLMVDGYRYDNVKDIKIQLDPADGVLNRIDRISGTWSKADRDIHYTIQKGEMSYEPVPKAARRTADYKDYVLADIYVKAGAIDITQKDITDQRLNSDVCGLAMPFADLDTSELAAQLQDFYKWVVSNNETWDAQKEREFNNWFENIKDQLTGDVAGNLQAQIGTLSELNTQNKNNLVEAINEAKESIPAPTNNLMATEPGTALDAVQGKVLDDKITALNNSISQSLGELKNYPSIVALDVSVTLVNSVATIYNANFKSTSKILITRKHHIRVGNGFWAAESYDGYAIVSCSAENANGTINAYILIINDV